MGTDYSKLLIEEFKRRPIDWENMSEYISRSKITKREISDIINSSDNDDILFYACRTNDYTMVKKLILYGADVNKIYNHETPLSYCCKSNHAGVGIIKLLLEKKVVITESILHCACINRDPETVKLLLDYGADPLSVNVNDNNIKSENLEVLEVFKRTPLPLYVRYNIQRVSQTPTISRNIKITCALCRTKCIFHKLFIGDMKIDCAVCLEKKDKNYSGLCGHTVCEDCVKIIK